MGYPGFRFRPWIPIIMGSCSRWFMLCCSSKCLLNVLSEGFKALGLALLKRRCLQNHFNRLTVQTALKKYSLTLEVFKLGFIRHHETVNTIYPILILFTALRGSARYMNESINCDADLNTLA